MSVMKSNSIKKTQKKNTKMYVYRLRCAVDSAKCSSFFHSSFNNTVYVAIFISSCVLYTYFWAKMTLSLIFIFDHRLLSLSLSRSFILCTPSKHFRNELTKKLVTTIISNICFEKISCRPNICQIVMVKPLKIVPLKRCSSAILGFIFVMFLEDSWPFINHKWTRTQTRVYCEKKRTAKIELKIYT